MNHFLCFSQTYAIENELKGNEKGIFYMMNRCGCDTNATEK